MMRRDAPNVKGTTSARDALKENRVPVQIALNDVIRMRKPHPCGGYEWRIVRLGADIGIKCLTCGRRVLLPRSEFERRLKAIVQKAVDSGL
jgi:hypothetical protein